MTPSQAKQLAELWSNDIGAFVEDLLPHFLTHSTPDFHKEIYGVLQKEKRIALAAPRGFAKSTIVSVFYVLHQALFGFYKDICIISASEGLAIEWLRKIKREIESNGILNAIFGDMRSDKWSEGHIILKNGVNIRARGAGGQIRGFRPDLVILDDIETDESVTSEEQRNKLREWVYKACLNTLVPNGQFIIIGTLLNQLSLLQEILDTQKEWFKKKYQAYKDGIQEKGHELWATLWSHERLQTRKSEIGTFAFATEFMNDPVSNETSPIKSHQLRIWENLPSQMSCVIAVDPAYSEDERADWKVAVCVGIDEKMNRYLLNYIRCHYPSGEYIDAILNMWLQNKNICTGLGMPKSGGDTEFWNSFMRRAEERKLYPPMMELKNSFTDGTNVTHKKKVNRVVAALQPLFENGKYYINQNHTEAKEELLMIGASRHDDLCLAEGTKIATINGNKNIEDVKMGDIVITPQGKQKVLSAKYTGFKKTIRMFGLNATPEHKIFSYNNGIASIDTLCYTDRVSLLNIKEIIRWKYQKLLCSMGTGIPLWVERENIIYLAQTPIREGKILKDFTWRFGNLIINRKFQEALSFTTKTATLSITTFLTLLRYRGMNTIKYARITMGKVCENTLKTLGFLLPNGTVHRRVVNGTKNTLSLFRKILNLKNENALCAENCLNINIPQQGCVQKLANKRTEEKAVAGMKLGNALSVVMNFLPINLVKSKLVQKSADTSISHKSSNLTEYNHVYNLKVENEGVYYANGILVSNCDAMAYAEQIIQPVFFDVNIEKQIKYEEPEQRIDFAYGL